MKGFFIYSVNSSDEVLASIVKNGEITRDGKDEMKPMGKQPPLYENIPLVFCSYYCQGYEHSMLSKGVIIESKSPIIYACPADTWVLMRDGNYIPGYEKFLFPTIEEMLNQYPSSLEFKRDFQKYFNQLNPRDIFRHMSQEDAEKQQRLDSVNRRRVDKEEFNEITFRGPLDVKVIEAFYSRDELKQKLRRELD